MEKSGLKAKKVRDRHFILQYPLFNMQNKVMIIDDDVDITASIQIVLEMEGFATQSAHKSEEIFEKVKTFRPNVILLDYLLSGKDGKEICIELKRSPEYQKIPVIMMSAHPQAKQLIIGCGAEEFMQKPFDIEDLIARVSQYTQI